MNTMPENRGMKQSDVENYDVVVVGAGFAGLYALYCLRALGFSVKVIEAGADIGGTWYFNRYPGARCDVESMQYSYSFDEELQQEWRWSELFATQPEILRYINHVADRFDLRRDIDLDTRVISATFEEVEDRWQIATADGRHLAARFCVMATGCLSAAQTPAFAGLESFKGEVYHTADWPREGADLAGKTVAVIGTGSSGIQAIPLIAEQAGHLFVFQRTPNFCIPAGNAPMTAEHESFWKQNYAELRRQARESRRARSGVLYDFGDKGALDVKDEERARIYEERWVRGGSNFMAAFNNLLVDEAANETCAEFIRTKIRSIVRDSAVADALAPTGYPVGTKRICLGTNYFETFNRPNVTLVDIRSASIERVTPSGLHCGGTDYRLDAIVFATGFDAITGALSRIDIRGRASLVLRNKWAHGPRAYLGLMSAGFPNMFTVTGPGSPSVLSNMLVSIEQHVDWIAGCLTHLRAKALTRIEARQEAEDAWVLHVNEVAHTTLYPRAKSWYMGANISGKPQIFMPYVGGVAVYREICAEKVARGYEGFELSANGHEPRSEIPAVASAG